MIRKIIPTTLLAILPQAHAHSSIEELVVFGRAQEQIGSAIAASEGLVGYDDLNLQPRYRVGELLETVPGMVATQHSGTGKANQYFLRGFNLDHGTDFSTSVDGVPANMRTHGHGQGYLDLNFVIPELVETNRYKKGPYHASVGDFSSAGHADFSLYDSLKESSVQATFGQDSYGRLLVMGSGESDDAGFLYALDVTGYEGPWQLDENLKQTKFYLASTFQFARARAKVALQGYDSSWDATDQIPERAVQNGQITRLGNLDDDLGGESSRYALTGELRWPGVEAGAYHLWYDLSLWSNFTYFLEDPINGDEFEQRDDRTVTGAWLKGERDFDLGERVAVLAWGADLRHDDISDVGLYNTVARQRINAVRSDSVTETSLGAWAELALPLTDRLRLYGGLRADWFDWDVDAQLAANSGTGSETQVSPKISLAWQLAEGVEAYASYGRGMHSNDVRGATITTDPSSLEPVDSVEVLVPSTGSEVGIRVEQGRTFNATISAFHLELDSELVYVGDGGTTEPNDATTRNGVEITAFWQPSPRYSFDAAWTWTDAEFDIDPGAGTHIPGALETTLSVGANVIFRPNLTGSLRVRRLGDYPLIEDGSVRAGSSLLANAGIMWRNGPLQLRLDAFNLFDSDDTDITYFYESRLTGEATGVEDVHFHPLEPRSLRVTATYHW